ncbi:polyketide cyclase [Arthrobacter deserti]|uniref:Polyketide cyclase n=1 Tax=Arthrobacter deserti TaxID=1742687 RepID=A0ABX1JNU8_9MICC|nr:polyketide cyclase [Arthrobacter deserti]
MEARPRGPEYEFLSVWRVAGTVPEVLAVLADVPALPGWWPAVYLRAGLLDPGGPGGAGEKAELLTTGWLPYTLRWTMTVTGPDRGSGYGLRAEGDLAGTGRWSFEQDGPEVVASFSWQVTAGKPLLRRMSWLLRPAFAANHRWAMARGQESLALELRRRRAPDAAARARVPAPPGPTFGTLLRLCGKLPQPGP